MEGWVGLSTVGVSNGYSQGYYWTVVLVGLELVTSESLVQDLTTTPPSINVWMNVCSVCESADFHWCMNEWLFAVIVCVKQKTTTDSVRTTEGDGTMTHQTDDHEHHRSHHHHHHHHRHHQSMKHHATSGKSAETTKDKAAGRQSAVSHSAAAQYVTVVCSPLPDILYIVFCVWKLPSWHIRMLSSHPTYFDGLIVSRAVVQLEICKSVGYS